VRPDGVLIAGQRRLAACKMLGWEEIPMTVIDLDSVVRGEADENVLRKGFTPSEAVAIWGALESYQGERSQPQGNLPRSQRRTGQSWWQFATR